MIKKPKLRYGLLMALATFSLGFISLVVAQDADDQGIDGMLDNEITNIGSVTCRDVLLASGDTRESVILVLHAYLLGEEKKLEFETDYLAEATDRFLDACIAKPDTRALATLREQVNPKKD